MNASKRRGRSPVQRNALTIGDLRVFKAGNSLAIRIPSMIAKHCGLEDGSEVEIRVAGETIEVRRAPSRRLQALIERITPENVHNPEFDELAGRERW